MKSSEVEKNHLNVENECLVTAEKPKKDIFRTQTIEVVLFVTFLCQQHRKVDGRFS